MTITKKVLFAAVFSLFASAASFAQDNIIDEVIWVVGDEPILKSEVENRHKDLLSNGEEIDGDPYCVIPEMIAVEKLFLDQAKLDSIVVNDQEVIRGVDQRIETILSHLESVERMEAYFEKSISQIREEGRTAQRNGMLIERVQESIVKGVKVTPAEVRRFYSRLPQDSIPFIPTQVEVQILTIQPKISQKEIDDIKSALRGYAERVNSGQSDFQMLASLYSDDVVSSKRGGDLGFRGKGEFVPEFSAVAFAMQDAKRVSKVVESEFGYHIIQLVERRGDRINCRHILKKPVPTPQETSDAMIRLDSITNAIKEKSLEFERAVVFFSEDKNTRNNMGIMANNNNGQSPLSSARFRMEELPAEVAKAVATLKPGEVSVPFIMKDPRTNRETCAIVKLRTRVEGHKANASEDFYELQNMVESQKRNEAIRTWIEKKRETTYVRINEKWRNCDFKYKGWIKDKE